MDYSSLNDILNDTTNWTQIVNNTYHDSDVFTVAGASWFKFKNTVATNLYVNSNGFIGFGVNSAQLSVNHRDQALWNLWRQEGTLFNKYDFIRLRWDGYSYYSQTSENYHLTFDVIILSTGHIYLSIAKFPTSDNNGTYSLTANTSVNYSPTESYTWTFEPQDADNSNYIAVKGLHAPQLVKYVFGDDSGKIYIYQNGSFTDTGLTEQDLTASFIEANGNDTIPEEDILTLTKPKIYKWVDVGSNQFKVKLSATPYPQTIVSEAINLEDSTTTGIESIIAVCEGTPVFAVSVDNGSTWKMWNDTTSQWVTLSQSDTGMSNAVMSDITASAWASLIVNANTIKIRFTLSSATDKVTKVTLRYTH